MKNSRRQSGRFSLWYVVGAVILGLLTGYWYWKLFAPVPTPVVAVPDYSVSPQTAQLFGKAVVKSSAAPVKQTPVVVNKKLLPNVKLVGVFAAQSDRGGFAILQLNGRKQSGVVVGEEVTSGVKLHEVYASHVILAKGSQQQKVELEAMVRQRR